LSGTFKNALSARRRRHTFAQYDEREQGIPRFLLHPRSPVFIDFLSMPFGAGNSRPPENGRPHHAATGVRAALGVMLLGPAAVVRFPAPGPGTRAGGW